MLYSEFMLKAVNACIYEDEDAEVVYLRPEWRMVLKTEGLDCKNVTDIKLTMEAVRDHLALEVERRRLYKDKGREVMSWMYNILTGEISPTLQQENNELLQDMIEYMKQKNVMESKEKKIEEKEEELKQQEYGQTMLPGFDFAKKSPGL